jgi:hypothetical protein
MGELTASDLERAKQVIDALADKGRICFITPCNQCGEEIGYELFVTIGQDWYHWRCWVEQVFRGEAEES